MARRSEKKVQRVRAWADPPRTATMANAFERAEMQLTQMKSMCENTNSSLLRELSESTLSAMNGLMRHFFAVAKITVREEQVASLLAGRAPSRHRKE